jgi:hypothetical protein
MQMANFTVANTCQLMSKHYGRRAVTEKVECNEKHYICSRGCGNILDSQSSHAVPHTLLVEIRRRRCQAL